MKKQYGIFKIDKQRELHSDDSYWVLNHFWNAYDTESEALDEIEKMQLDIKEYAVIIPVYSGIKKDSE